MWEERVRKGPVLPNNVDSALLWEQASRLRAMVALVGRGMPGIAPMPRLHPTLCYDPPAEGACD